jgi:hypothetical protein
MVQLMLMSRTEVALPSEVYLDSKAGNRHRLLGVYNGGSLIVFGARWSMIPRDACVLGWFK